MSTIEELAERVIKDLTLGTPSDADVQRLLQTALSQRETLERLTAENAALTTQVQHLNARLESIEPLTHLTQYAEGSA